jgi:hypothetical protein
MVQAVGVYRLTLFACLRLLDDQLQYETPSLPRVAELQKFLRMRPGQATA